MGSGQVQHRNEPEDSATALPGGNPTDTPGALEVAVTPEVAGFMWTNRLLSYFVIRELALMWQRTIKEEQVQVVLGYYSETGGYVVFARAATATAGEVVVVMSPQR